MNADRAAELLQLPERGLDLLRRFEDDEQIRKAIQAVQSGFQPEDVASMYGLPFDELVLEDEEVPTEGHIHVYECKSKRCRQKGRVATSSVGPDKEWDDPEDVIPPPNCPSCGAMMKYLMSVEDEYDISHLRRTHLPKVRFHDSMHGVDRSGDSGGDGDDDD